MGRGRGGARKSNTAEASAAASVSQAATSRKRGRGGKAVSEAGCGGSKPALVAKDDALMKLQGTAPSNSSTDKPPDKKQRCSFLCGSVCFETPDPIETSRASIRWAYDPPVSVGDPPGSVQSLGTGLNDWYCERAWTEIAPSTEHRNRGIYQTELSKDRDKLTVFLDRRQKIVERRKLATPKRRGGQQHQQSRPLLVSATCLLSIQCGV
jgi:hypothetical protein